jgi:hypothetical protein
MRIVIPMLFVVLVAFGMPLAIVTLPPIYVIAIICGVALVCLVFLRIIRPVWIVAIVFICAPFVDILRATYLKNIPFVGVYQEIILILLLASKIITTRGKVKLWRVGAIDYLIFFYLLWNLCQVIQSPSILGGLYVWRWYAVGPLTYLVFRLYSFTKRDCELIISSICVGLAAAAIYVFYQYFILGPENAAQVAQSLGFSVFYRIGWRLPGPFSSPLVASASYSILVLFGVALLFVKRLNWLGFFFLGLGSLAVFFTLSRSGIVIGLIGLTAILVMNLKRSKSKLLPSFLGILLLLQLSYLIPETRQFFSYITNTNLDSFDTDRIDEFSHIFEESATKYPFGIGFAGGGAISIEAYEMFGGDQTYMPDYQYLGGDSVLVATLQTSGFLGLFLLIAIYVVFVFTSVKLLACDLDAPQRVLSLVALGFFFGTLISLGNLIDVWPLKFYLWFFGAAVMNFQARLMTIPVQTNLSKLNEGVPNVTS